MSYDELIDERVRELMEEWPTLQHAYACENCGVLNARLSEQATCRKCGSASVFDVAALLRRARTSMVIDELRAVEARLDKCLGETS